MGFGSSLFSAVSSRSLLPSRVADRATGWLGYDRISFGGVEGRSILVGILNLLVLATAFSIAAGASASAPFTLCVAVPAALLALLFFAPKIALRGSSTKEILDSAFCLDVFSTVLLATGDIGLAVCRASAYTGNASGKFRRAVMLMRSGAPAEVAVLQAFGGDGACSRWVRSAVRAREGDLAQVISEWHSEIQARILKVDDMLSLLIAVSTMLPIGISMIMSVWRLVPTIASPATVIALSLSLQAIFIWFRDLEEAFS